MKKGNLSEVQMKMMVLKSEQAEIMDNLIRIMNFFVAVLQLGDSQFENLHLKNCIQKIGLVFHFC